MAVAKGGKHKMHRSSLKQGYYTQQFSHTLRNKLSLARRRARRAALWVGISRPKPFKRRAKIRGRLFGFKPHQLISTTSKPNE